MSTAEPDPVSSSRSFGIMATVVVVLVLVGYPLSIGPASYVYRRMTNPTACWAIETFYAPLEMATDDTPLYPILQDYLKKFE